jgi:hypothetical protein
MFTEKQKPNPLNRVYVDLEASLRFAAKKIEVNPFWVSIQEDFSIQNRKITAILSFDARFEISVPVCIFHFTHLRRLFGDSEHIVPRKGGGPVVG